MGEITGGLPYSWLQLFARPSLWGTWPASLLSWQTLNTLTHSCYWTSLNCHSWVERIITVKGRKIMYSFMCVKVQCFLCNCRKPMLRLQSDPCEVWLKAQIEGCRSFVCPRGQPLDWALQHGGINIYCDLFLFSSFHGVRSDVWLERFSWPLCKAEVRHLWNYRGDGCYCNFHFTVFIGPLQLLVRLKLKEALTRWWRLKVTDIVLNS